MAQIWVDNSDSMNNIIVDNAVQMLRFEWDFVTFSGEMQDAAQIRWRKAGYAGLNPRLISTMNDEVWPAANYATVGRHSFSYGYNITSLAFPTGTFTPGIWFFQVNYFQTGASDWSGWSASHKIEISPWEERTVWSGSAGAQVKGPHFQTEGQYGARIEVVSEAGIVGALSNEVTYNVWETNKYLKMPDGTVKAVPEHRTSETETGRVTRPS